MNKKPINNDPKMNMPKFNMSWIYILAIVLLGVLYFTQGNENSSVTTTTSYSNFKTWVMKGYASKIVVNKNTNTLQRVEGKTFLTWPSQPQANHS